MTRYRYTNTEKKQMQDLVIDALQMVNKCLVEQRDQARKELEQVRAVNAELRRLIKSMCQRCDCEIPE